MSARLKGAGLLWPTAFALVALAVLVGLGTWQMQRRTWKEALIAKIAARVKAEPTSLAVALRSYAEGGDIEYTHVVTRGRFHHDKERYLYAPAKSGLGWHVYTPLEFAPRRIVWVNRGFVPDALKSPQSRPGAEADGQAGIAGIVRLAPQPGMFTPQNDPARNLWYWPDAAAMTASAFAAQPVETAPVTIDADASPGSDTWPRGGTTRIDLPNRHLEYAVTWYGLALTLIGVYAAFAVSRLRHSGAA